MKIGKLFADIGGEEVGRYIRIILAGVNTPNDNYQPEPWLTLGLGLCYPFFFNRKDRMLENLIFDAPARALSVQTAPVSSSGRRGRIKMVEVLGLSMMRCVWLC